MFQTTSLLATTRDRPVHCCVTFTQLDRRHEKRLEYSTRTSTHNPQKLQRMGVEFGILLSETMSNAFWSGTEPIMGEEPRQTAWIPVDRVKDDAMLCQEAVRTPFPTITLSILSIG